MCKLFVDTIEFTITAFILNKDCNIIHGCHSVKASKQPNKFWDRWQQYWSVRQRQKAKIIWYYSMESWTSKFLNTFAKPIHENMFKIERVYFFLSFPFLFRSFPFIPNGNLSPQFITSFKLCNKRILFSWLHYIQNFVYQWTDEYIKVIPVYIYTIVLLAFVLVYVKMSLSLLFHFSILHSFAFGRSCSLFASLNTLHRNVFAQCIVCGFAYCMCIMLYTLIGFQLFARFYCVRCCEVLLCAIF